MMFTTMHFTPRSALWPLALAALALGLLAACAPTRQPDPNTPPATIVDNGYPSSALLPSPTEAYPGGVRPTPAPLPTPAPTLAPGSYPVPTATAEVFAQPRFSLDLPLTTGAMSVSGQALPNMNVAIMDVTFGGIVLGSGRADGDGRFTIPVTPLELNHRIGVALAELPPGRTADEMAVELFPHRGDGFLNVPGVGVFYESAQVVP